MMASNLTIKDWQEFLDCELSRFELAIRESLRKAGVAATAIAITVWTVLETIRVRQPAEGDLLDSVFLFGQGGLACYILILFLMGRFTVAMKTGEDDRGFRLARSEAQKKMESRIGLWNLAMLGILAIALTFTFNRLDGYTTPAYVFILVALLISLSGKLSRRKADVKGSKVTKAVIAPKSLIRAVWTILMIVFVVMPIISLWCRWDTIGGVEVVQLSLLMLLIVLLSYWFFLTLLAWILFSQIGGSVNTLRARIMFDPEVTSDSIRKEMLDIYPEALSPEPSSPTKSEEDAPESVK